MQKKQAKPEIVRTPLYMCIDVTNFVFAFNNMQILTTFQLLDIQRTIAGTAVKWEYFISCNLTEFN